MRNISFATVSLRVIVSGSVGLDAEVIAYVGNEFAFAVVDLTVFIVSSLIDVRVKLWVKAL